VRGNHQYKITSTSAPVGIIKEVHAERISFQVEEGDCIIMFSDGVEDVDSPLIADEEQTFRTDNCQNIAEEVLALAQKKHGSRDDATVCVCQINRVS